MRWYLHIVGLLFMAQSGNAQMSGSYTIGGVNPDFPDIDSAKAAVATLGISDTVIFNIRPGDYSATAYSFNYMYESYPIIFQSETRQADDVLLKVIGIIESYQVHLKHLTIRPLTNTNFMWTYKGLEITRSDYITMDSCVIRGGTGQYERVGVSIADGDHHTFTHNRFVNLDYALVYSDVETWGMGSNSHSGVTTIEHNVFDSIQTAIRIAGRVSLMNIGYNRINSPSSGEGIYLDGTGESIFDSQVHHNVVNDGSIILKYSDHSSYDPVVVSNNMVVGNISVINSDKVRVYYNSARGMLYIDDSDNVVAKGNSFQNDGYVAMHIDDPSHLTYTGEYNNYFRTDSGTIAFFGPSATPYQTVEDLRAAQGVEQGSISVDPRYVGPYDLHSASPYLQFAGDLVTSIVDDMDGETRHPISPDIGADEFNSSPLPPVSWFETSCNGYLTISFENLSIRHDSSIWDFGDGSASDTNSFPVHTFPNPGLYNVTLESINAYGSDTYSVSVYVRPTEVIMENGGELSISAGFSDYQWYFNQTPIMGETSNAYTPVFSGNYYVTYLDSVSCLLATDAFVYQSTELGEFTLGGMKVEVFPNPSLGRFNVRVDRVHQDMTLELFDMAGKIVWDSQRNHRQSGDFLYEVNNIESGLYYLKMHIQGYQLVIPIVVRH